MLGILRTGRSVYVCSDRQFLLLSTSPGCRGRFIRALHTDTKDATRHSGTNEPPLSTVRKAKVTLHPAPSKPDISKDKPLNFGATKQNAKPDKLVKTVSTASSHPEKEQLSSASISSSTSGAKSSFQIAAEDLQDATRHGVLIPPPPNAPWLARVIHQAKELFKFYWAGLKLIFQNRKHASAIRRRVREGGAPMTRWEARFIKTCDSDIVKLVPFVLILIIAEEALPLFVIYAPFLLPSTCLLASQRLRIEEQRAKNQSQRISSSLDTLLRVAKGTGDSSDFKLLCSILSLSTYGPRSLLRRRLEQHLSAVNTDNVMLLAEASNDARQIRANLSQGELVEFMGERGFVATDSIPPDAVASNVQWYFEQLQDHKVGPWTSPTSLSIVAKAALRSHAQCTPTKASNN